MLDADTIAVPASYEAAARAAGATSESAERLLAGEDRYAFSAMRPPGHHAESYRPMGFCLFNSIAVGAATAIADAGADRVLILDWDVHHGNGTEEIFYARDDVLFVSIHQSPLYPGTGAPRDVGTGAGHGFNINLPVPPGADGELYLALLEHVVAPIARDWKPDLIAISAGYDAHRDDPLANCMLEDADYWAMAALMRDLGGELDAPLLVNLEGGYDLGALSRSALATVRALNEDAVAPSADPGRIKPVIERFGELWPAALRPAT
jgi:acetoin utilization deacetylase AcuC-like enzyme